MGSAASRDVSGTKTITLISADNERFEVPEAAASLSRVIRNAIDNNGSGGGGGGGIRLSKIPGKVLAKVLEYCNKHAVVAAAVGSKTGDAASSGEATNNNEELRSFDEKFIEDVDQFMLYDLLLAAYYLEVQELVDLARQKVADRLEDRAVEIRKTFRIKDDYFPPPDEEEEEDGKQWLLV